MRIDTTRPRRGARLNRHGVSGPFFATAIAVLLLLTSGCASGTRSVIDSESVSSASTATVRLASSAWPMVGHDVRQTRRSPNSGPAKPERKWRFHIGVMGGDLFHSLPALGADGTVYVGSMNNRL